MDGKIVSAYEILGGGESFAKFEKIKNAAGEVFIAADAEKKTGTFVKIFKTAVAIFRNEFCETEKTVLENFEETLKKVNDAVRDDADKIEKNDFLKNGILIAIFADGALHFALCGAGEVYFVRGKNFATISEGLFDAVNFKDIFSNVASGDLNSNDKIIFSSYRLLRLASGKQISHAAGGGVLEAIESLRLILPEKQNCVLAVFNFKSLQTLPFSENWKKSKFARATIEKLGKFKFLKAAQFAATNFAKKYFSLRGEQKKVALAFASIFGIFLVVIFFVLISIKSGDRELLQFAEKVDEIKKDLIACENRRLEGKTDEANLLLQRIETTAFEISEKGYFRSEILQILQDAQKMKDAVNKITRISGAKVFADLQSVSKNLKGIFEFKNEILAFDENSIFEILQAGGEVKSNFRITENDKIISAAPFETKDEIVFLTNSGKIIEFENGKFDFATTNDAAFHDAVEIKTFSKYLYLLDPSENQIWKYERKDRGFTGAVAYNLNADLKSTASFAIDGAVYAFSPAVGKVEQIYRGKKQDDFNFAGVPQSELARATKILTNEELSKIFILDAENKRILVFSKNDYEAFYERQIVFEDVAQIRDFWVNAATNRLFFADESKIYEVGL